MKVLLASPNTFKPVYNQAGKLPPLTGICPPLGIGYLGAYLRKHGIETVLYDWAGTDAEGIANDIKNEQPDLVGISCFTITRGAAFETARIAKKVNPEIVTVLGGSHATSMARQIIERYKEVDYIVSGEGERLLLELVLYLEGKTGHLPAKIFGREKSGPGVNSNIDFIHNLDDLPFPVRKLSNAPAYKAYPEQYGHGKQASLMASRGCPYRCQFCSTSIYWGSRYRLRSVDNVIAENDEIYKVNQIEDLEILDDAFTSSRPWIAEFCAKIKKKDYAFDWAAVTRANYINEEICRLMKDAGCKRLVLGIESFSDKILKNIGKRISSEQAVNAIRIIQATGIEAGCLLMVGNPGDDWSSIKDNISAIKHAKPSSLTINMTQVYPQTELYEIAKNGGLLDDSYWLDEGKGAPIYTLEHSIQELQEFVSELYKAHWTSGRWGRILKKVSIKRK